MFIVKLVFNVNGLIAKNGILVVEFANQFRNDGYSIDDAIIESSLTRLRPVLMTTISTLLGAIPLVLSSGAGAESLLNGYSSSLAE